MLDGRVSPVDVVKRAAVEAVEASKPMQVQYGTVCATSPLQISLDQKITLGAKHLVLTRSVTDHTLTMEDGDTKRTVTLHNRLRLGEQVVLLRLQGGKRFLVLDRLGADG